MKQQILITKAGNIPVADAKKLTEAGIIIIHAKDPDAVKFLIPQTVIVGDDFLLSALHALATNPGDTVAKNFVTELYKRLLRNSERAPQTK